MVGTQVQIEDGPHVIRHVSPVAKLGGYLYGMADKESYSFQIGTRMASINQVSEIQCAVVYNLGAVIARFQGIRLFFCQFSTSISLLRLNLSYQITLTMSVLLYVT